MIKDLNVIPLKRIPDERGTILHMLKKTDEYFQEFGEIYFSTVHPGAIKGWHRHFPAVLNYAVVSGNIKLVLYDEREESSTKGELMELFIGEENYCLVQIPSGVWNGFKAVGNKTAIVANCCTRAHGDFKSERIDPHHNHLPYNWEKKDC